MKSSLIKQLLTELGENPQREGLQDTPDRYLKFLTEATTRKPVSYTTFEAESYDEMIVQSGIQFYSLCEHHLVPFFGTATVAYIPDARIIGLSKLARTVEYFSHGLQNQERITTQVCHQLSEVLDAKGVAVILSARHLCIEMRGIKKPDAITTTSKLSGVFKSRPETRSELMQLFQSHEKSGRP